MLYLMQKKIFISSPLTTQEQTYKAKKRKPTKLFIKKNLKQLAKSPKPTQHYPTINKRERLQFWNDRENIFSK